MYNKCFKALESKQNFTVNTADIAPSANLGGTPCIYYVYIYTSPRVLNDIARSTVIIDQLLY